MNSKLEQALRLVLEFVENHNKNDQERDVADATLVLEEYLQTYEN